MNHILSLKECDVINKHERGRVMKTTFMGVKLDYNPIKHRDSLVREAEAGLLTGKRLWVGLRASWAAMDHEDKRIEYQILEEG